MAKADLRGGVRIENRLDESVPKRSDYRAPKLTIVGTVHDLTLGLNAGPPDGLGGGTNMGG